jgi:hypothetical protein
MSKITFDQVRNEKSPDELFRLKIELAEEASQCHIQMHDGNTMRSRSELLKDINYNNDLIEYIDVRIKDARNEIYIANKENRHRLRRFKEICRMKLSEETFKEIEDLAKVGE